MSRQTEEKFNDLAKWFNDHKQYLEHPDAVKRDEALLKLVTNFMWILTYVVEDIQVLEGRHGRGGTGLLLPASAKLDRDLRQGGDMR